MSGVLQPHLGSEDLIRAASSYAVSLHDRHHDQLGFLPRDTFELAARRGRLLIATENGEACGMLLVGQRNHVLRIHQTCVEEDLRRLKHATEMVAAALSLPGLNQVRQIKLRVADDLPANQFWRAIGCRVTHQTRGSIRRGRLINHYYLDVRDRMQLALRLVQAVINTGKYSD